MPTEALQFARQNQNRFLDELKDLLRIPSISTLPEHRGDVRHAAECWRLNSTVSAWNMWR